MRLSRHSVVWRIAAMFALVGIALVPVQPAWCLAAGLAVGAGAGRGTTVGAGTGAAGRATAAHGSTQGTTASSARAASGASPRLATAPPRTATLRSGEAMGILPAASDVVLGGRM